MKQSDSDSIGCLIGLVGLYRTLVFIASGLKNVVVTALRPPQGTGYEFGANPHKEEVASQKIVSSNFIAR